MAISLTKHYMSLCYMWAKNMLFWWAPPINCHLYILLLASSMCSTASWFSHILRLCLQCMLYHVCFVLCMFFRVVICQLFSAIRALHFFFFHSSVVWGLLLVVSSRRCFYVGLCEDVCSRLGSPVWVKELDGEARNGWELCE